MNNEHFNPFDTPYTETPPKEKLFEHTILDYERKNFKQTNKTMRTEIVNVIDKDGTKYKSIIIKTENCETLFEGNLYTDSKVFKDEIYEKNFSKEIERIPSLIKGVMRNLDVMTKEKLIEQYIKLLDSKTIHV